MTIDWTTFTPWPALAGGSLIGLVGEKYYYQYDLKAKTEGVYSLLHNNPLAPGEPGDPLLSDMRNLAFGYYETSRYLLFNNKKKK